MRKRIFIVMATLVVAISLLTGVLASTQINAQTMGPQREALTANARLIAMAPTQEEALIMAHDVHTASGLRVSVMDHDGSVLYDSTGILDAEDNRLTRPEVQEALSAGVGYATRESATVGETMLYVAYNASDGSWIARMSMPVSGVLAQQRQSNVQIWMMLMIVMAALLLLVWRFSSFIVAPIGRLTQIAREYAAGNYQNRMDLQRKDEIGILGESLSQMSEQLIDANRALMEQNQRQTAIFEAMNNGLVAVDMQLHVVLTNPAARQMLGIGWNAKGQSLFVATGQPELEGFFTRTLKQENEPVEEFVFTRVRTHERRTMRVRGSRFLLADGSVGGAVALIEDVTELRRLENIRTEFAANVTHELKTPLTSIKGFVETLLDGVSDPAQARHFLQIIDGEADRLGRLINDILYLSELEGSEETAPQRVELTACAQETVELLKKRAQDKDIALSVVPQGEGPFVCMGNPDRVKQMMVNLLSNAINYTQAGGSASILLRTEPDRVVVDVQDTGIGIPQEAIPRLFERFYRVDKGRSRAMGGTGLGLAIVKHIVIAMHGEIEVQSEVGAGSDFIIRLPRA